MLTQIQRQIDHFLFSKFGILLLFWLTSWICYFISSQFLDEWMRNRDGSKWASRKETADSLLQKLAPPSEGGIWMIGSALLSSVAGFLFLIAYGLLMGHARTLHVVDLYLLIFPFLVLLFAVLGYFNDQVKATNEVRLSAQGRLWIQTFLAAGFMLILYRCQNLFTYQMGPVLNAGLSHSLFASWPVVLCEVLVLIGASNAVNPADCTDGLVAGLYLQVALVFSWLWLDTAGFPDNSLESTVMLCWFCLGGSCLAFLVVRRHPARISLGETGSLALGAAMGVGAIVTRTVCLLPFIGFVFSAEMLTTGFQTAHFRYTKKKTREGKRLHRGITLRHYLRSVGWSEGRVTSAFWAVNFCTTLVGLVLWKQGILPRFP